MRLFAHYDTVPHGFGAVCLALFERYPNPFAAHVLSSDVVARTLLPDGSLRTLRLMTKGGFTAALPAFVRALLPAGAGAPALVLEESVLDRAAGVMSVRTCNITHRRLLRVEEALCFRRVSADALSGSLRVCPNVHIDQRIIGGQGILLDGSVVANERITGDQNTAPDQRVAMEPNIVTGQRVKFIHGAQEEHTAIETRVRIHSRVAPAIEALCIQRLAEHHLSKSRRALLHVLERVYASVPLAH